ncbi:sensor kinase protein RcsC [Yersinia enterocolitica]|nr:sensor kinase protein RcsC [Yersinia enterocolitica]
MGSVFCYYAACPAMLSSWYQIEISFFISHDAENLPLLISGIGGHVMVTRRTADHFLYPEHS